MDLLKAEWNGALYGVMLWVFAWFSLHTYSIFFSFFSFIIIMCYSITSFVYVFGFGIGIKMKSNDWHKPNQMFEENLNVFNADVFRLFGGMWTRAFL